MVKHLKLTDEKREKYVTELIAALERGDEEEINCLACILFISNDGGCDWNAMTDFEKRANVKIIALEKDSFGWLIGGIQHNGKTYSYG